MIRLFQAHMADTTVLTVENLSVTLDGLPVLQNVSFTLKQGEAFAVIGPNGAGKTVLFRALLGLVPHTGLARWHAGRQDRLRSAEILRRSLRPDFRHGVLPAAIPQFLAAGRSLHGPIGSRAEIDGPRPGRSTEGTGRIIGRRNAACAHRFRAASKTQRPSPRRTHCGS